MVSRPQTSDQLPVARQRTRATFVSPACLMNTLWSSCDKNRERGERMGWRRWVEWGWSGGWVSSLRSTHDLYEGSLRWIKPSRSSRSLWMMHLHHATWAEILLTLPPNSFIPHHHPTSPPHPRGVITSASPQRLVKAEPQQESWQWKCRPPAFTEWCIEAASSRGVCVYSMYICVYIIDIFILDIYVLCTYLYIYMYINKGELWNVSFLQDVAWRFILAALVDMEPFLLLAMVMFLCSLSSQGTHRRGFASLSPRRIWCKFL